MYSKHFRFAPLLGLVLVIGLVLMAGSAMKRSAWNEGFMMGQLLAGGDAAPAQPLPYGFSPYMDHSRGFGFTGFLLGGGLILLILGMIARHSFCRSWSARGDKQETDWRKNAPPWAKEWARHKHWHHGPPPWYAGPEAHSKDEAEEEKEPPR